MAFIHVLLRNDSVEVLPGEMFESFFLNISYISEGNMPTSNRLAGHARTV
jgi:hypothetical protein